MNIIELVKSAIEVFSDQSGKMNGQVHIDGVRNFVDDYGISSRSDTLIKEDILGNEKRRRILTFYAMFSSINDFERINNSGTIDQLQQFLEHFPNEQEIDVSDGIHDYVGYLRRITCANAQMFTIPDGTMNNAVQYNLQITVEYDVTSVEVNHGQNPNGAVVFFC